MAHAERLIALEERFGIFRESALQRLVLESAALVDAANWSYVFGHWPVIPVSRTARSSCSV